MARTPRNRTHINISDASSTTEYLNKFSGMNITAAGGYSKNINDEGWVTQSGGFEISNQGLVKTIAWAVAIISQRAKGGNEEAQMLLSNLGNIATASANIDISKLSASIELKSEGDDMKVENISSEGVDVASAHHSNIN
tara:strand:+ start:216 stop:632 length:417 start_codon:yes stop_codon:yes gene_type:complete